MSLFETNIDDRDVDHTLEQIEYDLSLVLNGRAKEVSYEELYHSLYTLFQNDYGNLVENLTSNKIQEVFSHQLDNISREGNSLQNIYQTFSHLLQSIDKLSKPYFYFEEKYYQEEKHTSLKVVAYNKLKELLVKKEELFVEFLSELTIFIFKIKNKTISEEKDIQLMSNILSLIQKLDNEEGEIHIFNHYLKDLYTRHMVMENAQKIALSLKQYDPKRYFKLVKVSSEREKQFIYQYFFSKKTEPLLKDITKQFYSNWITESWNFITSQKKPFEDLLQKDFLVVYDAIKTDLDGLKSFMAWYVQLVNEKLKSLDITDNESLVRQFQRLYNSINSSLTIEQSNPLFSKVRIAFQNWLNNDSINIVDRLVDRINVLLVTAFETQLPVEQFEKQLQAPMLVFKYVKQKDMFELSYGKTLLERMSNLRYSKVMEQRVLKLIKAQCGESWTSKIEAIIKENQNQLDPTIVCINQTHWQTLTNKQPQVADLALSSFHSNSKSLEGKDAKWLLNYGFGIIRIRLGKQFDLKLSTKSMQLMLHFNTRYSLVLRDYLTETKYDIDLFKKSILCLVKSSILKPNHTLESLSDITLDTVLYLNVDYSPAEELVVAMQEKQKLVLSLAQKQELTQDRKLIIEGIITKLIKVSKTSTKSHLIEQTLKIIDKKGFSATLALVELSFNNLQDRGYISVLENLVSYCP